MLTLSLVLFSIGSILIQAQSLNISANTAVSSSSTHLSSISGSMLSFPISPTVLMPVRETTPPLIDPEGPRTNSFPTSTLEYENEGSFMVSVSTMTIITTSSFSHGIIFPGVPYLLETETILEPITFTIPVSLKTTDSQGLPPPPARSSRTGSPLILGSPEQTLPPAMGPDYTVQSTPTAPSVSYSIGASLSHSAPSPSPTTVNLGGLIYSEFNQGSPSPTITAAGEEITVINPSVIALDGATLVEGAGVATVFNEILSLGSSDALVIVSPSRTGKDNFEPLVLTVAGQIVSAAVGTNAIIVGSLTLAAGGPGVTLSGTPVSLATSGVVVAGTSSLPIAVPPAITIGSQVYAVSSIGPGDIVVASRTITPEGPAVTISGTLVSLAPSDVLIVGNATTNTSYYIGGTPFYGEATSERSHIVWVMVGICTLLIAVTV